MTDKVRINNYENIDLETFFRKNGVEESDLEKYIHAQIVIVPPLNIRVLTNQVEELSEKIFNFSGIKPLSCVRPELPEVFGSGVEIDLVIVTSTLLLPIFQGLISAWIYDKLLVQRKEPSYVQLSIFIKNPNGRVRAVEMVGPSSEVVKVLRELKT